LRSPIIVLTKDGCPPCDDLKSFIDKCIEEAIDKWAERSNISLGKKEKETLREEIRDSVVRFVDVSTDEGTDIVIKAGITEVPSVVLEVRSE